MRVERPAIQFRYWCACGAQALTNPDPRRPCACTCKLWAPQAINPNSDRRIQLRRHRNCYPASQRRGRIMHAAERQCNWELNGRPWAEDHGHAGRGRPRPPKIKETRLDSSLGFGVGSWAGSRAWDFPTERELPRAPFKKTLNLNSRAAGFCFRRAGIVECWVWKFLNLI